VTIAHKLAAGLGVLSCLGILAMLVTYRGMTTVERAMRQLAEVREPVSSASHEMEINVNGIGLAVFRYLDSADEVSRLRVLKDAGDFERFHARYLELAQGEEERRRAATLGALFEQYRALAGALIAKKDEQEEAFAAILGSFERLDSILDDEFQPGALERPGEHRALLLLRDVEADVAELAAWLANYQRTHDPAHRAFIQADEQEIRGGLRSLAALPLTPLEQQRVRELETILDQTMARVQGIVAADDHLRVEAERFDGLRATLDDLLDEEVQASAYRALQAPRLEADRATERVVRALQVLIPAFFLAAFAIGAVLMRVITIPLRRLTQGTAAISEGDLSHRVTGLARDELGDLAAHFNQMVERLEATTVSKTRLEASEAQLRAAVIDLRREIAERLRAEIEKERLQESLRRSETMSAMGSLVAGVAHEVRNPLFAISSTLDALEARLGSGGDATRPHLDVLREEVGRLSRLMRDLLRYGTPPGGAHVPDSIAGAIAEAIQVCSTLARDAGVAVESHAGDADVSFPMDRVAMVQVFRNLLENAIQHSPPGGVVTVDTAVTRCAAGGRLECVVTDGGAGFREDEIARVFEPFFSRRRGGTGLGLSIVQRIVEEHGGQVRAANGRAGGAVLTMSLPLDGPALLEG
jgi:signal transduction histidine kinase